jgi:hypothetical protein
MFTRKVDDGMFLVLNECESIAYNKSNCSFIVLFPLKNPVLESINQTIHDDYDPLIEWL